jgi:CHAD domain-containing protein
MLPAIRSSREGVSVTTPITADQSIAEAVRSLLGQQFTVLQEQEARYWAGERKDAVHRMRVALRRMRALLRLHGDRFTPRTLAELTSAIRRAGRKLGQVRDLDVFVGHLQTHQDSLPEEQRPNLDRLIDTWKSRRKKARRKLNTYLRGKEHRQLLDLLGRFTSTAGRGVRPPASPYAPDLVRHVLGSSLWQRYENVWAFAPLLEGASMETLHDLRIECKYLRYALEFFSPVFDEQVVGTLISEVVALQDHLGELHDASVAGEILTTGKDDPGRAEYLASREAEATRLLATFPPFWHTVDNPHFRRHLASMLAHL